MAVIEARQLSKSFPGRGRKAAPIEAVRDVTFSIEAGERIAYIGPNGAGKSTSIKMLTGILHPSAGAATVLGYVPWTERRHLAQRIGTLFGQRSQLWFQLTPRQAYRLLGDIYGLSRPEAASRVDELGLLLEATDLFDRQVKGLSLGQRMRCELAASLLHSPEVLFLDEPTIGLDLVAKQRFREMIVRLNEEKGTTVFLTSHDVADIEHVARRVIVINHGHVIYDDRVSTMRRSILSHKLLEVRFDESPGDLDIAAVEILKHSGLGYKLIVDTTVRSIKDVLDELLDRFVVGDISVEDSPLEDVIGNIYESPER
jgi:ABC-2 type transport system ATP-binding protein